MEKRAFNPKEARFGDSCSPYGSAASFSFSCQMALARTLKAMLSSQKKDTALFFPDLFASGSSKAR